jgi:hypothetical protein
VTARSNCTLAFVFNKTIWGGGSRAEGHRQKDAKDRVIGTSGDRVIGTFYERGSQEKVFTHDWWRGIHAASSPKPHLFRGRVFSCVLDDAHLGGDDVPWFLLTCASRSAVEC